MPRNFVSNNNGFLFHLLRHRLAKKLDFVETDTTKSTSAKFCLRYSKAPWHLWWRLLIVIVNSKDWDF